MHPLLIHSYRLLIATPLLNHLFQSAVKAIIPTPLHAFGVKIHVNPADTAISLALWLHLYETNDIRYFRSLIQPGQTVLDIGANVGIYTAVAAHDLGPNGTVHAFEPEPIAHSHLLQTIRDNGFTNVSIHHHALSHFHGHAQLSRNPFNLGDNSLHEPSPQSIQVPVQTLDETLGDIPAIHLIKMDVQGAELNVLRGAQTLLQKHKPSLFMELDAEKLALAGHTPADVEQFLQKLGYQRANLHNSTKLDNVHFLHTQTSS